MFGTYSSEDVLRPLFLSVIIKCKNCAAKLSGKCPIRRHWGAIYDIVLLASVDHDG